MDNKRLLLKGTIILTLAGFITKMIGFIYRIFLSQAIGAQGMGIYQLIFPINTLCFALSVGGIQTAISRFTAARAAKKTSKGPETSSCCPQESLCPLLLSLLFCSTEMLPGLPAISCWRKAVPRF